MTHLSVLGGKAEDFPPTFLAMRDPNGLLAIGGDLRPQRLLAAYRRGIFPWFDQDQPILWWTPDPRMVLFPPEVHCSRSMAKFMRKSSWQVSVDCCFEAVIDACAGYRPYADGTWISADMKQAYCNLFAMGYAHSIEVFDDTELVGGLYGVALGHIFFGESMFSRRTNASKLAFITLARWLQKEKFAAIDCQVANPHLQSLGARDIPREDFESLLRVNTRPALINSTQTLWQTAQRKSLARDGTLHT